MSDDLSGMKILVVDDEPVNIEILFQALEPKGYQIFMAANGVKALELAAKIKPDLILLDVMMPEMDGIETCKRLKEDASLQDVAVIFVTAKTGPDDIIEGFKVGGVDYISKPFRLEELLARVETHLRLRKTLMDKDQLISELQDTQEVLMNSATMDLLTGLYNRPGLENKLEQLKIESQSRGKTFSIILSDIDGISKINHDFGMQTGDQVIIRTASLLTESVRTDDLVGRWSSEEFLILLPDTGLQEAKSMAEKIRSCVESERLDFNQAQIPLTLSLGVNECSPDLKWDQCLADAQECLHQAKKLGRNRMVAVDSD